jgi:polysaccharide chain length determinant protein (PEP-CTERM system associated)
MDELIRQFLTILRGIWHRRWIGLIVAWVVGVVGAVVILRIPDRYEANARIFVDTQSVLKPLMAGLTVQPNIEQQIAMLARTLITRPSIDRLLRNSDMDLLARTPRERERLIDELIKEIKLTGGGRENIYNVSYQDVEPERARRVVQNLVSMFVESGLGDKRRDAESARRFIEEQIKNYEKKLEEAENQIKEFRIRNLGLTGGNGQDYFGRMSALNDELAAARLELRAAEQSRDALKRELSGEDAVILMEPGTGTGSSVATPELDARIEAQRKSLDELLRRYTDEHPDVVGTKRLIAQLEDQKREEIEARRKVVASGGRASGSPNPVIQQLKVTLAESEAKVASLRGRIGELSSRVENLKAAAERVPKVESEFAQLNRDYDILKKNYEQLVSRRESASISGDVDAVAGIADFRLIDPPRTSSRPVFPNRMALVPLVLGVSLAAGIFAAFAVSQVFPVVQDARALRTISSRPVLGSVSFVAGDDSIRSARMANAAFSGSLLGLIVIYGAWSAWVTWTMLRG